MNKTEYIQALRDLADFIENRPFPEQLNNGYDEYPSVYLSLYTNKKDLFSQLVKAIGTSKKTASDSFLTVTREENFRINIHAYRDSVCERVIVGTKTVPAKEEEIIPAEPEHEEDIVQWKCPDSFMALSEGK